MFPDVTYSFYPVYCGFYGIPYREIPLTEAYEIDLTAYKGAQGIVLANPNAPTGIALQKERILRLAAENPDTMIIVDEAYADFSDESVVRVCTAYKNLVVVRTLSKSYSLAGLRLGYAVGDAAPIAALHAMKDGFNSYTTDTLAQAVGTAALRDGAYYRNNADKIVKTRQDTVSALAAIGYTCLPSGANFVFARCPRGGEAAYRYLKDNGILVRYFAGERTHDFVRITVGTDEDMRALTDALTEWK